MDTFYCGVSELTHAAHVGSCMVSVNALRDRRSPFVVGDWIIDSGGFNELKHYRDYRDSPEEYAAIIRRFATVGNLQAAVAQDYMCEPFILGRTGLTIADHQRLTIERYDALLRCDVGGVYIMPVLQGYLPSQYADHVRAYGDRLAQGAWVGVGSVCKRNRDPSQIEQVLLAIRDVRPDLRLHGFGIKITALQSSVVREFLHSADSMAWSFAGRFRPSLKVGGG
jgi:hypothetical protein